MLFDYSSTTWVTIESLYSDSYLCVVEYNLEQIANTNSKILDRMCGKEVEVQDHKATVFVMNTVHHVSKVVVVNLFPQRAKVVKVGVDVLSRHFDRDIVVNTPR